MLGLTPKALGQSERVAVRTARDSPDSRGTPSLQTLENVKN